MIKIKRIVPSSIYDKYLLYKIDKYLISFPKSGRTWVRMLIGYYLNNFYNLDLPLANLSITQRLYKYHANIPRISVSHYGNPHLIHIDDIKLDKEKFKNKKVIFLIRDPRPIAVSNFYQFMFRGDKDRANFKNFSSSINDFVLGNYGGVKSIVKYYNLWLSNYGLNSNFFIIKYENLLIETKSEFEKILSIFNLPIDHDLINETINFCNINNLKKLEIEGKLNEYHFGGTNMKNSKVRSVGKKKWFDEVNTKTRKKMNEIINNKLDKRLNYDNFQ